MRIDEGQLLLFQLYQASSLVLTVINMNIAFKYIIMDPSYMLRFENIRCMLVISHLCLYMSKPIEWLCYLSGLTLIWISLDATGSTFSCWDAKVRLLLFQTMSTKSIFCSVVQESVWIITNYIWCILIAIVAFRNR